MNSGQILKTHNSNNNNNNMQHTYTQSENFSAKAEFNDRLFEFNVKATFNTLSVWRIQKQSISQRAIYDIPKAQFKNFIKSTDIFDDNLIHPNQLILLNAITAIALYIEADGKLDE